MASHSAVTRGFPSVGVDWRSGCPCATTRVATQGGASRWQPTRTSPPVGRSRRRRARMAA